MQMRARILSVSIALYAAGADSQVITFNNPVAWTTQRNDSITVRAQIDTAQAKKKQIAVSVQFVNDRQQEKRLASTTFPITDYTGEFALGPIKQNLVGGLSFIKVDWSIPGTANKGSIAPIGIVALDKLAPAATMVVPHAKEVADAPAIVSALSGSDYKKVGSASFGLVWNKNAFCIVIVKSQAPGTVRFSFDGKNGKNAFLSFSDRVVVYNSANDSLWGLHYSRSMEGAAIKYAEKPWTSELKKSVVDGKVVIMVPWFDTGIIPFEERKIGLGITEFDAKGQQVAALPVSANYYLPGTWGDILLSK